jgi:enoyl-CoA hydratase
MVADVGTCSACPSWSRWAWSRNWPTPGAACRRAEGAGYGLVNEVFDTPEAMLAAALQCAREIAAKPPVAIWGTKQVIHYTRDHSTEDSLQADGLGAGAIWSNAHVREAVTSLKTRAAGGLPGAGTAAQLPRRLSA